MRSRSTATPSPKLTRAGASSRTAWPFHSAVSAASCTVLPGTFSVAVLATVASAPARLVSAAVRRMASASSGPFTATLAEPPMPPASIPSASSVAATAGWFVGVVTRADSTARATALPGMPACVASSPACATPPASSASAVTLPLTAWPISARRSSSRVMRRLTLPSGRVAPGARVTAPSACRLFQSARSIVACSVPSARAVGMQRQVQRRALQRALRQHAAGGLAGQARRVHRHLHRAARHALGADLARQRRRHRQVVGRPLGRAGQCHRALHRGRQRGQVGQPDACRHVQHAGLVGAAGVQRERAPVHLAPG